jgi:phage gpG-like protein
MADKLRIEFTPSGKKIGRDMQKTEKELRKMMWKATEEAGKYQLQTIRKRLIRSQDIRGRSFKWFSKKTIRRRPERASGRVLLGPNRRMLQSIFLSVDIAKGNASSFDIDVAGAKNRAKVAAHNRGLKGLGQHGQTDLPKREFYGFSKKDEREIKKIFDDHTDRAIKRHLFKYTKR